MYLQMRTSHAVYHANDAGNRCLYNSLSIIIYGNESYTARLKLISVLNGISQMDKIMEEVSMGMKVIQHV